MGRREVISCLYMMPISPAVLARGQIEPVAEISLTQPDSSRNIACAGFVPTGGGAVLCRCVGQFDIGVYTEQLS